jgi:carbon storage regulator
MLVLTRRIGETIVIGDGIEVLISAIKGRQVRLGITAPVSVRVARQELLGSAVNPRFQTPSDSSFAEPPASGVADEHPRKDA